MGFEVSESQAQELWNTLLELSPWLDEEEREQDLEWEATKAAWRPPRLHAG